MGSGGGGGDGGMMQMMMMIQMQQQMEEQRRQQEAQAFQASQRAENQNYQRYNDHLTTQNKKVGDQWDLYNANIDKIMKINPGFNTAQRYTFNPYAVNPNYKKSRNRQEADENADLLNKWYADADKQSLDDYNMAKSQYDASKTWLSEAQAAHDAGDRVLGAAPAGAWGAGGEMVSGGAGADAEKDPAAGGVGGAIGDNSGLAEVFSNFGTPSKAGGVGLSSSGGMAGSSVGMGGGLTGSGFLGDDGGGQASQLAGMMGQAIGGGMGQNNKQGAGTSIF